MQQLAKVSEDLVRLVFHLAPGDPDHPPTGGLEVTISFTVGLERASRSVCGAAVQLDDHPLGTPEAVGFNPSSVDLEQGIELRGGKVRSGEQSGEPELKPAADATARTLTQAA